MNDTNVDLNSRLNEILDEIKNYPTPIAGCDVQFNYLLEQKNILRNLLNGTKEFVPTTGDFIAEYQHEVQNDQWYVVWKQIGSTT